MTGTVVAGVLHSRETAARIRFVVRRRASTSAGASPCVQLSAAGTAAAAAAGVVVESRPHQLHIQAADRAREGVPLQPLPDARTTHRDRRRARSQRDAGQDLVPEPSHEAEKAAETSPPAAAARGFSGSGGSFYRVRVLLNVDRSSFAGQFGRGSGVLVDVIAPHRTDTARPSSQLAVFGAT